VEEQFKFAQEGEGRKRVFIVLKDGNYKKKKDDGSQMLVKF